jgi:hypothetical protein
MKYKLIFLTEMAALAVSLALAFWRGDISYAGIFAGYTVGVLNHLLFARDMRRAVDMDFRRAMVAYAKGLFQRFAIITLAVAFCGRFAPAWLLPLAGGVAAGIVAPLAVAAAGAGRGSVSKALERR